jgi:hypothetical protein
VQERGFGGGEVFGVHRHGVDAFLAIHEETAAHASGGLESRGVGQNEKAAADLMEAMTAGAINAWVPWREWICPTPLIVS